VALLVVSVSVVLAQIGGGYDLTWSTLDNGGTTSSSGGSYALNGTIGQADAGTQSGGAYTLVGGFWGGASGPGQLYLPLLRK
jgi:hypothetical protein